MSKWLLAMLALVILGGGAYVLFTLQSGDELHELSPKDGVVVAQSDFQRRIHSVAGEALLIEHDGQKTLRFEDFQTDNGPQLHIYLAKDLGAKDFVDLGPIRATRGDVNYVVDPAIDVAEYDKVLVWCVPFGVLFSYADLNF